MSVHRVAGALVVLLALASGASAELVSNSGLMVYYSFDDAANLAYDSSGNEFHGTVVNDGAAPTLTYANDSQRGGVANFANATTTPATGYIDLPFLKMVTGGQTPTSNFTLAAWVNYASSTTHEVFSAFVARPTEEDPNRGTMCVHAEIRPGNNDYRFVLREQEDGTTIADLKATGIAAADEWHHLAMTYDRSLAADQMKVYLDGSQLGAVTPATLYDIAPWDKGARIGATADNLSRPLIGMLDEFYLFNRTLGGDEIGNLKDFGVVPEPSSLTLCLFGMVVGGYAIWRRRSHA